MGKAEALRQAQIDMRTQDKYSHPYYWAGFVLSGDGGEVTSDVSSGNGNSSPDSNNNEATATPVMGGDGADEPASESVATESAEESIGSGTGPGYPCLGAFLLLGAVVAGGMSRKRRGV